MRQDSIKVVRASTGASSALLQPIPLASAWQVIWETIVGLYHNLIEAKNCQLMPLKTQDMQGLFR
jgi:hypothetical protein